MGSSNLITPSQAAEMIGVDDSTIRRLIIDNRLSGKLIGGRYLLEEPKVIKFRSAYIKWARIKKSHRTAK